MTIFCLSALFFHILSILGCTWPEFRCKKNWFWHGAGNTIPVLKPAKIACFLFCIISFPWYHLNIDTTCHTYPFQNTLKAREEKEKKKKPDANSPCHDLDGRKTKTCAELNGILMNLFMTGNNLDCIKNMSGPWNSTKIVSKICLRRS